MDEQETNALPQAEEQDQIETQADTTQQEEEQSQAPQTIKVKFDHEEREIPLDEAVTHIQKGMNYERAVERARQEARDAWIAEQGYEWKGKVIQTETEYKAALQEKDIEDRIRSQYENVPEEIISELIENRRFRQETQAERQVRQQQESKQKEYTDFINWHTTTFGREPDPKSIPADVWKAVNEGTPLKVAYMDYTVRGYRSKEVEAEKMAAIQQNNSKFATASTGSVKSTGKPGTFYTREQVESMSTAEIYRHYDAVEESRKHWK